MGKRKQKPRTFHVQVTGTTEEYWDIEADTAEEAEKIGKEWFTDAFGDRFENISSEAEDVEDFQ